MNRSTFGTLTLATFGLVLASFVLLGFGRIALGYRTGLLLAAPTSIAASGLVIVLLGRSLLAVTGVAPLEDADRDPE